MSLRTTIAVLSFSLVVAVGCSLAPWFAPRPVDKEVDELLTFQEPATGSARLVPIDGPADRGFLGTLVFAASRIHSRPGANRSVAPGVYEFEPKHGPDGLRLAKLADRQLEEIRKDPRLSHLGAWKVMTTFGEPGHVATSWDAADDFPKLVTTVRLLDDGRNRLTFERESVADSAHYAQLRGKPFVVDIELDQWYAIRCSVYRVLDDTISQPAEWETLLFFRVDTTPPKSDGVPHIN